MSTDLIVTHVAAAIAVILGLSYAFGQLFRRLRQPEVIGQLFIGIALGPSLLGHFSARIEHTIFPVAIMSYLNVTAQVALVLFLFAVGYDLNVNLLRQLRGTVSAVSAGAFVVPMLLGTGSAYLFGHWYRATGETGARTGSFMVFMGVAVTITAVPVLASIIRERGIAATPAAVTAMISAAATDVLGWLALAGVLLLGASASSSAHRPWPVTVVLLAGFVVVMVFPVRRALRYWMDRPNALLADKVPVAVAVAMGSAWATAALGLHVIFGAFLAGLIMPRQANGQPDADLLRPVQDVGRLLLPLFFVVSGLSANVSLLRASDFALFGVICAIAIVGKVGAGSLAARATRMRGADAVAVGVLLNTRGLTELIALNVALQAGIIHQRLYTVLVLMALLTTAITSPLLTFTGKRWPITQAPHVRTPDPVVVDG